MRKIKSVNWFTQGQEPHTLGIVVIENEIGERKAYVGSGEGYDEGIDAELIADHGARVHPQMLRDILREVEQHEPQED